MDPFLGTYNTSLSPLKKHLYTYIFFKQYTYISYFF